MFFGSINPLPPSVAFLYLLKTSENLFSDVLKGYRKVTPGLKNWVKEINRLISQTFTIEKNWRLQNFDFLGKNIGRTSGYHYCRTSVN